MLEELAFVTPNKAVLPWAQRGQVSVDSFKGALVTPRPRAAASAAAQQRAEHTGAAGLPTEKAPGEERGHLRCRVWPPQERRWRRARQRQKDRRKPQGLLLCTSSAFFCPYENVVVIKTSPSPRQALLIAQLG